MGRMGRVWKEFLLSEELLPSIASSAVLAKDRARASSIECGGVPFFHPSFFVGAGGVCTFLVFFVL